MPFGLAPLLEKLEIGKISQPIRLGKGYCLVELLELVRAGLTPKPDVLAEQLRV